MDKARVPAEEPGNASPPAMLRVEMIAASGANQAETAKGPRDTAKQVTFLLSPERSTWTWDDGWATSDLWLVRYGRRSCTALRGLAVSACGMARAA